MIEVEVEILSNLIEAEAEVVGITINGANATIENSNATYTNTVAAGGNLVLPDENFDVYVNGVLNTSFTYIPLSGEDIIITA